jgi:FixJ family two-component response regulator
MDSKLTLKLDKSVIEQAKQYAKEQKISLSRLIENYLASLTQKDKSNKKEIEISPFVKSIATGVSISSDIDAREVYREHLLEKYK